MNAAQRPGNWLQRWRRRLLPASLRQRLMLFLLAAVSLAAVLQALSAYWTARGEADDIFDYHMQQMAFSLRGSAASSGSGTISLPLGEQQSYDFQVQVWSLDGAEMFRSPGELLLPQRAVLGFSNISAKGHRYRVFSIQTRYQVVQVAQDLAVRSRMASQLAFRTALPTLLMLPLLALVVWWVVSHSLEPVERVRAQLAARAVNELAPVNAGALPSEMQPLVQELNSLLERVRRAFEDQQHFVADAAHELRSPLTALKLQLQSLQSQPGADQQALTRLGQGVERAVHLVEQLLALARQEGQATQREALQPLQLAPLCREAVIDASDTALARSIDLGLGACDESVWIAGQEEALRVLLRNLLDNAIKYSPAGGQVDLSLVREGDEALLCVEDNGPGIAPDERTRVFDRFYRSSQASRSASGSGLGLAIVRTIAHRHGGRLSLDRSPALGGLRVALRLRLASH